jgi:cytochrome o ubiquinol oxidase operon protein cyoD
MKKTTHLNTDNITSLESAEGSYRSYTLGFLFSVITTLVPYFAFTTHTVTGAHFIGLAIGAGLIQLYIQLVFFLHLGLSLKKRMNLIIFVYTIILVGTIVAGSLWIMKNLNHNMINNVFPDGNYTPQAAKY